MINFLASIALGITLVAVVVFHFGGDEVEATAAILISVTNGSVLGLSIWFWMRRGPK